MAELAVRELIGELALDALVVEGDVVRHRDGRAWHVATELRETGVERAESCGKPLVPMSHVTVDIREVTPQ